MQVDTSEFRALTADVAEIKEHLARVRFEQVLGDMQTVMAEAFATAELAARPGGRRRRARPDGSRPSHLRMAPGERRSS